jgi:hypothetical protein
MRRGRMILAPIAVAIAALAVAPGAFAATPGEICRDLADGTLNGSYSAGDIATYVQALGSDPSIQGYCTPFTPQPPPETPTPPVTPTPPTTPPGGGVTPTPPTGGVLPAVSPTVTPTTLGTTKTLGQTKATGTLPFTGTELTIFAVVGLALVGTGLLLRSTARQRS